MTASASYTLVEISDGSTPWYQYAQNTSGTTAPTSGWSAAMPSGAAGKFIWRREGYGLTSGAVASWGNVMCLTGATGATGAKGDKGDTGASAQDFTITASPATFTRTSRGVTKNVQTITLTCSKMNIGSSVEVAWSVVGAATLSATSGESVTVTIASGSPLESFTVSCAVSGFGTKTLVVQGVKDGTASPEYFGKQTEAPTTTSSGEPLIAGDWFLYSWTTSGTWVYAQLYTWNSTQWITDTDNAHATTAANDFASLSPSGDDMTLMGNVFIRRLIALKAAINELGASQIHLQTLDGKSGCVYGGSYNADGTCSDTSKAGFWLGESGDFKVNNISATGILSLKDSNGDTVFENTLEKSGARISLGTLANDSFRVGDFTSGAGIGNTAMAVTKDGKALFGGVYDGNDILLATLTPPHTAAADFGRDASIDYTEQISGGLGLTNTAYYYGYSCVLPSVPYAGSVRMTVSGTANALRVYRKASGEEAYAKVAEQRVHAQENAVTLSFGCNPGDVFKVSWFHYHVSYVGGANDSYDNGFSLTGARVSYTGAAPGSLYLWNPDGSLNSGYDLEGRHKAADLSLSVTVGGKTYSASSCLNYLCGGTVRAALGPVLPNGNYECSPGATNTLALAGTTYTVTKAARTDGSLTFTTASSGDKQIPLTAYFHGPLAFAFTPVGYKSGIIVRSVNAVGGGSCGTAANPFSDGYFKRLSPADGTAELGDDSNRWHEINADTVNGTTVNGTTVNGTTVNGNVNEQGTANKVWGAVAN